MEPVLYKVLFRVDFKIIPGILRKCVGFILIVIEVTLSTAPIKYVKSKTII